MLNTQSWLLLLLAWDGLCVLPGWTYNLSKVLRFQVMSIAITFQSKVPFAIWQNSRHFRLFSCNQHEISLIKKCFQRECAFESRLLFPVGKIQWYWSHRAMESIMLRARRKYKGSTLLKPVNSPQRSPTKGIWNISSVANPIMLDDLCLSPARRFPGSLSTPTCLL